MTVKNLFLGFVAVILTVCLIGLLILATNEDALAGSILKMNHGLRNLISFTGDTLDHLWRVTSLNQAIALGIDDRKGSIKVNKDADLVILDDDMNVKSTIKQGKVHTFS